jgi:hypothetical protein
MKRAIHLEHRASSSWSKNEGESSFALCDRLDRTRDNSQRQLPTDHDYAVPTREYQTDQSSLKSAPAAARSVLGKNKNNDNYKDNPTDSAELTGALHIRANRSLSFGCAQFQGFPTSAHRFNNLGGPPSRQCGTQPAHRISEGSGFIVVQDGWHSSAL